MTTFNIALCGLTARDQRLLEIVVNRPAFAKHSFKATEASQLHHPDIAIVDPASAQSLAQFVGLSQRSPNVVPVMIEDATRPAGVNSRYWIPRRALLVSIFGLINRLVETEFPDRNGDGTPDPRPAPQARVAAPDAPAAFKTEDTPTALTGTPQRLHALVVDDSLAVREQLREGLERMGFVCHTAEDAESAQVGLGSQTYNLVLLDVVMPGLDGYELCRIIKKDRFLRKMPVVMLTSRSSPFDRARGTLSGCDAYLTKPVAWSQFSSTVDKVMMKTMRDDRNALIAMGFQAA